MGTAAADQPSRPTGHAEPEKLLDQLVGSFRNTAESVIPWFVDQMPRMYFQDTDHSTQLSHLKTIVAARSSDRPIDVTLVSDDGSVWTTLRADDNPGVLAEIVKQLPMDHSLRAAKVHTSLDGQIVLDTFEFGEALPFDENDPRQLAKLHVDLGLVQRRQARADHRVGVHPPSRLVHGFDPCPLQELRQRLHRHPDPAANLASP